MAVEISDQMQIPTEDLESGESQGEEEFENIEELEDDSGIYPGMEGEVQDLEELPADMDEDAQAPDMEVAP